MELRSCFDTIYLSSDAGICKPQPEFLKQVLDDYGLNPSETVMVGNDLTTDIAVAKAVGIDGILLNCCRNKYSPLWKTIGRHKSF